MVGTPRLELGTSSLSETRSNQLSYAPMFYIQLTDIRKLLYRVKIIE